MNLARVPIEFYKEMTPRLLLVEGVYYLQVKACAKRLRAGTLKRGNFFFGYEDGESTIGALNELRKDGLWVPL